MAANGTSHRKACVRAGALVSCVLLWLTAAGLALAAPQGEQVVSGDAAFERNGPDTVIRAADDTIIEYQSFDIAGDESVRFIQPDELSRVLNRIGGANPTEIYGSLTANGIVYLVNPGGIYFRDGCLVDVGGIYAAAAQMSNADFLGDVNRFTDASGEVVNYGTIQGDAVHLVGARAANYGDIAASNGIVTLAAGEDILIGRVDGRVFARVEGAAAAAQGEAAVENAGEVDASGGQALLAAGDMYALAIRNSGHISGEEVTVEGQGEGAVEMTGEVDAPGGTVQVLGDEVRLAGADVDASGAAGGEVTIGGGVGSDRTSLVEIDGVSVVRADALGAGDGGLIVVRSDSVSIQGTLSASPGTGDVANGLIVIDPAQVEIVDGAAGDDVDPATIEGAMDGGADFVVEAEDKITVTDDVTTTVDNGTTLSLNDEDDPNDTLTIDLNDLIALQPGQTLTGEATTVNVGAGGSLQNGIDVAFGGATVEAADGTYTEDLAIDKSLTLQSQNGEGSTTIQLVDGVGIGLEGDADNFTLGGAGSGFTILSGAGSTFLIELANAPSNVSIVDNTINTTGNATMGISIGAAGADELSITDNTFTAGDLGDGSVWGPSVSDLTVSDNTMTGPAAQAGSGYALQFSGVTGISNIQGNTITDYANGILISNGAGVDGLTITGNDVSACTNGIRFAQYSPGVAGDVNAVSVTNNTLTGNETGLLMGAGARLEAGTYTITGNDFDSSTEYHFRSTGGVFTGGEVYSLFSDGSNTYDNATVVADGANVVQDTASLVIRPGIQQSIDDSSAGDDIVVLSGTGSDYTEDLVIDKSDLTLRSTGGRDTTTIQLVGGVGIGLEGGADNVILGDPDDADSPDQGFTIQGGAGTTFLVQLSNGPSGVTIRGNKLDMTTGGGNASMGISVGAAGATGLTVDRNQIVAGDGDGAMFGDNPIVDLSVTNNTLTTGGPAQQSSGYGIEFFGVTASNPADPSVISDNDITGYAQGIVIANGTGTDDLEITGNTIDNVGGAGFPAGTGIRIVDYTQTGVPGDLDKLTIDGNDLNNQALGIRAVDELDGAPANFGNAELTITDNTFSGNTEDLRIGSTAAAMTDVTLSGNDGGVVFVGDVTAGGTAGDDTLIISGVGGTGTVSYDAGDGDDTITVDFGDGNPVPDGGLNVDGGTQGAGGDSLELENVGAGFATHTYNMNGSDVDGKDGSIVLNGDTINFDGLEPITNDGTAADIIFNLTAAADDVTLQDNGAPADGSSQLADNGGTVETTTFVNPTNSLTVNGDDGGDTLELAVLDNGFAADITLDWQNGDDTATLGGSTGGEPLNVTAETITITGATDASVVDLDASDGAGDITDTGAGALTATGATTLTAQATDDITLDAVGNDFQGAVSIPDANNVTLVDTDALQLGASTISGSLEVTASGTITQSGAVTAGATMLDAGGNDITLNDAGNVFGDLTVTGGTVRITENDAITDGAAWNSGATILDAGGNAITLDNGANDFTGDAVVSNTSDVILVDANDITLGACTIAGILDVTTSGQITQSGALDVAGATTLDAGGTATPGNDIILDNAANDFDSDDSGDTVTVTQGGAVDLADADTLRLGAVNAGTDVTVTAQDVELGGNISGTGDLLLRPVNAAQSIGIGGGAGNFNVNDVELGRLVDGFNSVTIGRANGQHVVTVDSATFNDPATIRTPAGGSIAVDGQITGAGDASITLDGPDATTTLNADIVTVGNAITISDNVLLGTPALVTLDTTNGGAQPVGANVTVTGTVEDTGAASGLAVAGGTGGAVDFQGDVGGIAPPAGFAVSSAAQVDLQDVTTTGAINVTGTNIDLNGDTYTSNTGFVTLDGAVDLDNGGTITVSSGGGAGDDITITGAVADADHADTLRLDAGAAGDVDMQSAVGGGGNHLAAFTVADGATVDLQDVTTTGAINVTGTTINLNSTYQTDGGDATFDGDVVLHSNTTMDTETGGGDAAGAVDLSAATVSASGGGIDLDIDTSTADANNGGAVALGTFDNVAGGGYVNALGVNSTSGGAADGAITLNNNARTAFTQTYTGPVTLAGALALTGTTINFDSTLDGGFDLDIIGNADFDGLVGDTAPLASLEVTGNTVFNAAGSVGNPSVETTGLQTYGDNPGADATTLNNDTVLDGTTVTFNSKVDGASNLDIFGIAVFSALVGDTTPLTSVEVTENTTFNAAGSTIHPSVETTGLQRYGDAPLADDVTLNADTVLTTGGVADLTLDSEVDGNQNLVLQSAGITHIKGEVGGTTPLASLTTDAAGVTRVGADIGTQGGTQTYEDPMLLMADVVLTDTGGTGVRFGSFVDATNIAHGLTVNTPNADTVFDADVGGGNVLGANPNGLGHLTVDAQNITLHDVTTVGNQEYDSGATGIITLSSDYTSTGGDILFDTHRAVPPNVATICQPGGDVNINASNDFVMTENDKMSVVGDLAINAGNEARLSDLSVLGDLNVNAPTIWLVTRDATPFPGVLDYLGGFDPDNGLDFVTGGNPNFGSNPVPTDGRAVVFATPAGGAVPGTTYTAVRWGPVLADHFDFGGQCLDLAAAPPVSLAQALAGIAPEPAPVATVPPNPGQQLLSRLKRLGIFARTQTEKELIGALIGFALYNNVPAEQTATGTRPVPDPEGQDYTVSSPRLSLEGIEKAAALYEQIFWEQVQGKWVFRGPRLSRTVEQAVEEYKQSDTFRVQKEQTGREAVDGMWFRTWLEETGQRPEALRILKDLEELFRLLAGVGLNEVELETCKGVLLRQVDLTRAGLGPAQVEAAILG